MGKTRRIVRYLGPQEIVDINRKVILESGGSVTIAGRLRIPNSLHYLVQIIQAKLDNKELYPSLSEKAALYAFNIITRHIFWDGNKRTGFICTFLFLRLNGCILSESIPTSEIVELALGIAKDEVDFPTLTTWIKEKLIEEGDFY